MNFKKIFALNCILLGILYAGERPTFDFLRQDVGARASAMAGSFISMQNDPNALFYNPASLATITAPQISLGYIKHLLDINTGSLAYSQEFLDLGIAGIGVSYVNYGSFTQTDELGVEHGTFGANDLALIGGIAIPFEENLYYGVTAKFIYSSIAEYNSSAAAADIGIMYLIPGDDPISLAAVISNIGAQFDSYGSLREKLPLEFKVGGTIKPQHLPLLLNLNFRKLNEQRNTFFERFSAFTVGGEFTLSKVLRFRFGYNNENRKELKIGSSAGMAGFSLGGGLVFKNMRIDYAFNSLGRLGSLNKISVGFDM